MQSSLVWLQWASYGWWFTFLPCDTWFQSFVSARVYDYHTCTIVVYAVIKGCSSLLSLSACMRRGRKVFCGSTSIWKFLFKIYATCGENILLMIEGPQLFFRLKAWLFFVIFLCSSLQMSEQDSTSLGVNNYAEAPLNALLTVKSWLLSCTAF